MSPSSFRHVTGFLALALAATAADQPPPPRDDIAIEAYRALGHDLGQQSRFADLQWTETQMEAFLSGIRDAYHREPRSAAPQAGALQAVVAARLQELAQAERQSLRSEMADPARREAYIKRQCSVYQLDRTDSGLAYRFVNRGNGSRPEPHSRVVVSYAVRAADAQTELPHLEVKQRQALVSELPPGLGEAVQMMSPGSVAMLLLPPELTYGSGEWPAGVDRDSPLFFALTLEAVVP